MYKMKKMHRITPNSRAEKVKKITFIMMTLITKITCKLNYPYKRHEKDVLHLILVLNVKQLSRI